MNETGMIDKGIYCYNCNHYYDYNQVNSDNQCPKGHIILEE